MNLDALKEPLGERFAELETYLNDLIGQRDAARKESQTGRQSLKAKADEATATVARLMEKLGIETLEELDALPPAKGQAEALKQLETRLKALDAAAKAKDQALADLTMKHRQTALAAELNQAMSAYEFIDRDLVESYLRQKLAWDEEQGQARYQDEKGNLLPLTEGVTHLAASKPHLLKSPGARGSGYYPGARGGEVANPWAKATFNLTEQLRLADEKPALAAQLKAAASPP
jgi:hypothetical protein